VSCIRQVPGGRRLFLTFDDGPAGASTEATAELLARLDVRATFFVVAERARRQPGQLHRLVAAGHAVGNHSLDHRWGAFFGSRQRMLGWVKAAEATLSDLLGAPTVGFRSPAGVRTPPLHWALRQLGMPLIHWNVRFYDAVWCWREAAALASLRRTPPGSIVLLHDRQKAQHLPVFLATLERYVEAARAAGFTLSPLTPEDVRLPASWGAAVAGARPEASQASQSTPSKPE
jgi:peptidoglycan/xylan/chitin deacetylase (PgdA/CDA1 family)